MTLQELIKSLEDSIELTNQRIERERILGNTHNTSYYLGKFQAYSLVLRMTRSVDSFNEKELSIMLDWAEVYESEYELSHEGEKLRHKIDILKEVNQWE